MEAYTWVILLLGGFFAGLVDAIAGGGGLISLPMLLGLGVPPHLALGTNKIIGISASLISTVRYGFARSINWQVGLPMAAAGLVGGGLGAKAVSIASPLFLKPFVLVGLCCVALYMMCRPDIGRMASVKRLSHPGWPCVIGLFVGFYDGYFGPGTGTFLMLAMITLFGQTLLGSSASARLVNYATNLGALLVFFNAGLVNWRFALPACLAALIGSYAGASISLRQGARVIRPVYLGVVMLLIVKLAVDFLRH